jgi:hypothetical protein
MEEDNLCTTQEGAPCRAEKYTNRILKYDSYNEYQNAIADTP